MIWQLFYIFVYTSQFFHFVWISLETFKQFFAMPSAALSFCEAKALKHFLSIWHEKPSFFNHHMHPTLFLRTFWRKNCWLCRHQISMRRRHFEFEEWKWFWRKNNHYLSFSEENDEEWGFSWIHGLVDYW